jgi:O-antigen/teichoic acid export membrane protein
MSPAEESRPFARGLLGRYRAIIGQGAWVFVGQVSTGILTLGGTRLITQFVNPELYGLVNLVQNALVLLRTLFCSPTINAGLRYYPDAERGHFVPGLRAAMRRTLGISLIAMEIIAVGGGLIWTWRSGAPAALVAWLALFVVADVSRTFELSLFNAARRQRPAAILGAAETLIRPVLVVGAVLAFGPRIEVVFAALALSIVLTLVVLFTGFRPAGGHAGGKLPPQVAVDMRRYAIPLVPIAFMTWVTSVSDRYLIEWLSHDTASVGVYAAGYGLVSQPFLLLHGVVALTLRPAYFAAVSRGDGTQAKRIFLTWLALSALACSSTAAVIFLARNLVVDTFLGPQFRSAGTYVPWIALGYMVFVIEQVLEQHLLAHKRTVAVLVAQACGAVASIAVTIPLVAKFGALGAAFACPVYFSIQCLVVSALLSTPRR